MPPKSIFRQPGAQHFQLVHRSQRDPLIHDPDASQHVLKAFVPSNTKKGKSRAELESILSPSEVAHDQKARVGEASLYGIYYDDTDYDYMQHLRAVGEQEEGVDSVLIEAPAILSKSKGKSKAKEPISLRDLPAEALPSISELPRNYESHAAVPSSIAGFRPDMDPHLRQALEALENDAFVDDGLEDDFFGELIKEGERGDDEEFEYEFEEDGVKEGSSAYLGEADEQDESWETRFAKFKKDQKTAPPPSDLDSDLDGNTEGGDTVGRLPKLPVLGGKRRRKGASDASGYSMTSSSMFRTEAELTLDERFDQVYEKEYAKDISGEDTSDSVSDDDSDTAPDLITTREDFEAMMDDFLDNYELLGRKMKPVLAGDNGAEKLSTLRMAMGQDERVRIEQNGDEESGDEMLTPYGEAEKKDRWDCETILTTYSNLENHPRLIRARDNKPVPKIILDPRTGLPTAINPAQMNAKLRKDLVAVRTISEEDEDEDGGKPVRGTITRARDESKEEKKARKQAVKAERQGRRVDKKVTKEQFSAEMKHQLKGIANKEKVKMRKL